MDLPQGPPLVQPIERFWLRLRRLAIRLMAEKAHVEVTLTIDQGRLVRVRVNRQYLPENLPD